MTHIVLHCDARLTDDISSNAPVDRIPHDCSTRYYIILYIMNNKYFIDLFKHFKGGGSLVDSPIGLDDIELDVGSSDKKGGILEKISNNPKYVLIFIVLAIIVIAGLSFGVRYLKGKISVMRSELPDDFQEETFLEWGLGDISGIVMDYSSLIIEGMEGEENILKLHNE